MFKFIATLLVIACFLIALVLFGTHRNWISTPSFLYQTIVFVTFTTTVIFGYLYRVATASLFVQLYLLTMVVKVLAYGAYSYFMIMSDEHGARINVAFFLLSYLIFTATEIAFLYRRISSHM